MIPVNFVNHVFLLYNYRALKHHQLSLVMKSKLVLILLMRYEVFCQTLHMYM